MLTHLGADIADLNAGEREMVFVTHLDHEDMHTELLAADEELRIDTRVGGGTPEVTVPPLEGREGRCVENKLLRFGIVYCFGAESSDVASVSKFRLRI
jgi:hypothetical protein